ncbi:MAG: hypothetical protein ABFD89_11445 [Bryobacteraceae bacterium]
MRSRIVSNWKTSTAGVALSVFLAFVLFAPQYFPPVIIDVAKFVSIGGAAALGIAGFDRMRNQ